MSVPLLFLLAEEPAENELSDLLQEELKGEKRVLLLSFLPPLNAADLSLSPWEKGMLELKITGKIRESGKDFFGLLPICIQHLREGTTVFQQLSEEQKQGLRDFVEDCFDLVLVLLGKGKEPFDLSLLEEGEGVAALGNFQDSSNPEMTKKHLLPSNTEVIETREELSLWIRQRTGWR